MNFFIEVKGLRELPIQNELEKETASLSFNILRMLLTSVTLNYFDVLDVSDVVVSFPTELEGSTSPDDTNRVVCEVACEIFGSFISDHPSIGHSYALAYAKLLHEHLRSFFEDARDFSKDPLWEGLPENYYQGLSDEYVAALYDIPEVILVRLLPDKVVTQYKG